MITKQLTTTGPLPPPIDAEVHVETLHDYDLCVLLDVHLFDQAAWCAGISEWRQVSPSHYVYQCGVCGAIDPEQQALHVRQAPWYGIHDIVAAMAARGDHCFLRFSLIFYRRACGKSSITRALVPDILRLVGSLRSPRLVAMVALEVLGVVDERGYLTTGGARCG